MPILLATLGLILVPSICYAHSGTVFKTVANYLPFLVPFISAAVISCRKYIARFFNFLTNKKSDDKDQSNKHLED